MTLLVSEFNKCKKDILYFKEKYLGLPKDEIQDECINLILKHNKINLDTGKNTKKTTAAVVVILHKFIFESNQNIGIVGKTLNLAKDNLALVKYYYDRLPEFLQHQKIKVNKTEMFNIVNGSKILVKSLNENSFRGFSMNFVLVDYIIGVKKEKFLDFYETIIPSMSDIENSKIVILDSMNITETENKEYNKIKNTFFSWDGSFNQSFEEKSNKSISKRIIAYIKHKINKVLKKFDLIKG